MHEQDSIQDTVTDKTRKPEIGSIPAVAKSPEDKLIDHDCSLHSLRREVYVGDYPVVLVQQYLNNGAKGIDPLSPQEDETDEVVVEILWIRIQSIR